MYVGVRAGGGIGDELEDPAGDPYELYRILFDITFFFFVIVILLAIIQGTQPTLLHAASLAGRVVPRVVRQHYGVFISLIHLSLRFDHRCLWGAERPAGAGEGGHGGET